MTLLLLILALLQPAWAAERRASPDLNFKTGQVIGISTLRIDSSSLFFEGFSGSRYSHVGVISTENGEPAVYHSYPREGAQVTPLPEFLEKASLDPAGRVEFTLVEPANPLTAEQERALAARLQEMVDEKAPFNYSMKLDRKSVNCAELVHRAFHAIGIEDVGQIGALARMNLDAFDGMLAAKIGRLPRLLDLGISPVSVIHSRQMKVVHAGLPVDRLLSDFELYKAWKNGGGLEVFAKRYGMPVAELHRLGKRSLRKPYRRYPPGWRQPG